MLVRRLFRRREEDVLDRDGGRVEGRAGEEGGAVVPVRHVAVADGDVEEVEAECPGRSEQA